MALSCDLKDIAQAASGCEEQFAGLGTQIYVAYPEDLTAAPEYEENGAKFTEASFTFKSGKGAWKFRIKKQTGQITSTGNEGAKGWNVQLLFTIDKDVENASERKSTATTTAEPPPTATAGIPSPSPATPTAIRSVRGRGHSRWRQKQAPV